MIAGGREERRMLCAVMEDSVASRLNEFTRFMKEFGPRAFDQLAVGRLGASIAAAAEGIPADVTPLDGLAAHWSTLSADEKARFFRTLAAGRPSKPRAKARARARTAVQGTPAPGKPKRAESKSAGDAEKARRKAEKKAKKQAKKEAKAKAKLEKKLKKKAKKEKKAKTKDTKKTKTRPKEKNLEREAAGTLVST